MSQLDGVSARSISFLFTRCQARLDGADLVVAVPAPQVSARAAGGPGLHWEKHTEHPQAVLVECDPGTRQRADRSEYPVSLAYPKSVEFRFRGGVWYGRVPVRGHWALCVQGAVRSLAGLPAAWAGLDVVLVETSYDAPEQPATPQSDRSYKNGTGPINGPHLPYP
ncbi:MAG: hypothetical protein ACXWLM_12095 [Myxococcales bacterium]